MLKSTLLAGALGLVFVSQSLAMDEKHTCDEGSMMKMETDTP